MKLLNMKFSASQVSELTLVPGASIQNWVKRKLIVGHRGIAGGIEGGGSQGRHRQFSYFNVIEISLLNELVAAGLSPSDAAGAASTFAHTGGKGAEAQQLDRVPGLPFHFNHGETILAVGADKDRVATELWDPGSNYDTFGQIRHAVGASFTAIDASQVFIGIAARLRDMTGDPCFGPLRILDEAYPAECAS